MAVAHIDRRGHNLLRGDLIKQLTYAKHIRYRVQRAYFVEMDVFYLRPVCGAFRLSDNIIDRFGICFHLFREVNGVDKRPDLLNAGVVVMGMLMFTSY